ncbi:MAG: SusD/RagB family nutrient-binding outer membrane lipoprotein [Cyclobacteriaceae bacterium]|nr:SusD/RagB family nutrient-binding outer membrane lipoprotein [Cyclobacteriaceae bacterium]
MRQIKIFIVVLITGVLFTTSCEFGDINVDPTTLSSVQLKDQLPVAIGQTVFNIGTEGARAAGLIMQQYKGIEAQQQQLERYIIDDNTFNNFWSFGLYGGGVLKDCKLLIDQGTEKEQPYYVGIAKVLLAVNLGYTTLCWGDVPYSEAFRGTEGTEFFKPVFDTQESIFANIQTLLDEAIVELNKPEVSGGPGSDDLIYAGDPDGWIQTAYALKARYHLYLVKRDGQAASKAVSALNNAYGSLADESMFTAYGGRGANDANPLGQFGAQRPNTLAINDDFAETMDIKGDPRQPFYMANDGSNYIFYTGPSGLFWSSYTSPAPIISYSEQKFLEAEALLGTGDATGSAIALEEAIEANMEQMGIDPADYGAYVAAYGNFTGLVSDDERLERILTEKYFAMYGQGFFETWTDYRRTGYPDLEPIAGGVNGSNPSGVIPRRWTYPTDEKFANTENVNAAVQRLPGGRDLLDVDVWAFE